MVGVTLVLLGIVAVVVVVIVVSLTTSCDASKVARLLRLDCKVVVLLWFDRCLADSDWMAFPFFCFCVTTLDNSLTY